MTHTAKIFALCIGLMAVCAGAVSGEVIYAQPLAASENPVGHRLKWATATEINVSQFVIEKSVDGVSYYEIGTLEGAGYSKVDRNYHFMDVGASDPTNYYRLKEVADDGTNSTTDPVVLKKKLSNAMNILEMTSVDVDSVFMLTMDVMKDASLSCSLTDLGGNVLEKFTFLAKNGVNKLRLELFQYPAGPYKFNVQLGTEIESFTLNHVPDAMSLQPQTADGRDLKKQPGRQR